ncbi:MAG: elongation factor Ts [Deltaproteobacteria bacterium]|nr:MAG: elongation factor Ts [Deltaproteobacteria bacterium]
MAIDTSQIKELRERTGAGIMDCKIALTETGGDIEKAIEFLRKRGIAKAAKKATREVQEGIISAYIHPGAKIGVLVEVNCETDFVARNEEFQEFVKNIAMHIAAMNPQFLSRDSVDDETLKKEKEILKSQAIESGKPEKVIDKIVEGRMKKFFEENCLLEQPYVKDTDKSVEDYLKETIAKLGENIVIRRFARFQVNEAIN